MASLTISYCTLILMLISFWVCLMVFVKINLISNQLTDDLNISVSSSSEEIIFTNRVGNRKIIERGKTKYHVPKFMLELYERNKFGVGNNQRIVADIVRSLIPKHAGIFSENDIIEEMSDNHLLIFDLPSVEEAEERFIGAELKILTLVEINSNAFSGIERQLKISVYDDLTKQLYHLEKVHVYHTNNTWLTFNVTKAVNEILQETNNSGDDKEQKFLKIVISVYNFLPFYQGDNDKDKNKFKLSLMPVTEDYEHNYPILLLSYTSNNNSNNNNKKKKLSGHKMNQALITNDILVKARRKRDIKDDYEEETNQVWNDDSLKKHEKNKKETRKKMLNNCRRKPLYIDFSEIDYDLWIVQPPGYQAYQCQGKCFYPVAEHLNPTKHAIVQALLHSVSPQKASRSCCVPTILDSISILYVDNGVLTYRYEYQDMVVVECGCR